MKIVVYRGKSTGSGVRRFRGGTRLRSWHLQLRPSRYLSICFTSAAPPTSSISPTTRFSPSPSTEEVRRRAEGAKGHRPSGKGARVGVGSRQAAAIPPSSAPPPRTITMRKRCWTCPSGRTASSSPASPQSTNASPSSATRPPTPRQVIPRQVELHISQLLRFLLWHYVKFKNP